MNKQMGYYELMNLAAKNLKKNSETHAKSKNEDAKEKELKAKIESFKKKVEAQKAKKAAEEEKKKKHLLSLRNQNKKSQTRVNKMLKMTKSANKACMGDARDSLQESVTELDEYQPDQDDYGYTSSHAEMFHKKFLEKYNPANLTKPKKVEAKHDSISGPINSVRCLNKGRRDETLDEPSPEKPKEKPKEKKRSFPELSYHELLSLAKEKHKEPVLLPVIATKKEEKFEFGRPMTAKEKEQYLQEVATRQRIEDGTFIPRPESKSIVSKSQISCTKKPEFKKIPLKGEIVKESRLPVPSTSLKTEESKPNLKAPAVKQETKIKSKTPDDSLNLMRQVKPRGPRREEKPENNIEPPPQYQQNRRQQGVREVMEKPKIVQQPRRSSPQPRFHAKKQIIESDDEEYDSEMDDFIDDSPMDGPMSISDMIRDITGYDKRRFADDSDDDIMETSFAQQQREEHFSLKAGIKEDEEEERKIKEEEARERKKLIKKRKKM